MPTNGNPFADDQPRELPVMADLADSVNPYESPREPSQKIPEPVGLWRDGKYLVAHQDSVFPAICVRTNEPAKRGFKCELRWSYPIDISMRRLYFTVGLCESCIQRYRRIRIAGWTIIICAVLLLMSLNFTFGPRPIIPGFFVGGVLVIGFVMAAAPGVALKIKRPRPPFFWIKGVHPDFLAGLPKWEATGE